MENGVKCEVMCLVLKCFKLVVLLVSGCNKCGSVGKCFNVIKCWYLEVRCGIESDCLLLEVLVCVEKFLCVFLICLRVINFFGEGRVFR